MLDRRAYTEVYEIITQMSDELREKIPKEVRKAIEEQRDRNYVFFMDEEVEEIELLEDTEKILSVLYTDYLATEEERKVIQEKEKILAQRKKEKAPEMVIQELFKKNKKQEENQRNSSLVVKEKKSWYQRLKAFLQRLWKRK